MSTNGSLCEPSPSAPADATIEKLGQ
eukprot:COSAG05_NODE_22229_length_266_cov_0.622754_1_plen_25_part_10